MRTDRGWRRFYAAGWLISARAMAVAFRMWQLHYAQNALTVQVNDDGKGVSTMSAGPGLGLIGMRERVSALRSRAA